MDEVERLKEKLTNRPDELDNKDRDQILSLLDSVAPKPDWEGKYEVGPYGKYDDMFGAPVECPDGTEIMFTDSDYAEKTALLLNTLTAEVKSFEGVRDGAVDNILELGGRIKSLAAQSEANKRRIEELEGLDLRRRQSNADQIRANWRYVEKIKALTAEVKKLRGANERFAIRRAGDLAVLKECKGPVASGGEFKCPACWRLMNDHRGDCEYELAIAPTCQALDPQVDESVTDKQIDNYAPHAIAEYDGGDLGSALKDDESGDKQGGG